MAGPLAGALAQTVAPGGCPLFHCVAEATSVMQGELIAAPTKITSNSALGTLRYQGCSGDGQRLSCLYSTDNVVGPGQGTLKVLDAVTLMPIWGSATAPGSYDPVAGETSGQVPLLFDDGRMAAGDSSNEVLYDRSGAVVARAALTGRGRNFGLTPIGAGLGIVSQSDGTLTLLDLSSWRVLDVLTLRDPRTSAPVSLVSPSSGSAGSLYAVAINPKGVLGLLFVVQVEPATRRLAVRASAAFSGKSGASPVVLSAESTGLAHALVLLHVPGPDTDPRHRLVALADDGGGQLTTQWVVPLDDRLAVSPTVDARTGSVYFVQGTDPRLFRHSVSSGELLQVFDLQQLTGLPGTFEINGHLAAMNDESSFTLLLSAAVGSAWSRNGQYVIALDPDAATAVRWSARISTRPDKYTAAWNIVPSRLPGVACLAVVGNRSGVSRLCDF